MFPVVWFQRPGKKLVCVSSYHHKRKLIKLTYSSPPQKLPPPDCVSWQQNTAACEPSSAFWHLPNCLTNELPNGQLSNGHSSPSQKRVRSWARGETSDLLSYPDERCAEKTYRGWTEEQLRGHREGGERLTEIDEIQRERG